MPNINGTLDVVLGFITIVLVLSLVIQSLQNVIKRLLRMKSRQAEQSLRMLFDYVLTKDPTKLTEKKYASPVIGALVRFLTSFDKGADHDYVGGVLLEEVKRQVREMGRKSFWGNALLDSVTKEDLDKILKGVEAQALDDAAKAAIHGRVDEVMKWYDTVMPGLSERYERGMKWMAVLLSAIVVVLFNADAIKVYKYVASDPVVQQQLLDYGNTLITDRKTSAGTQPDSSANATPENPATAPNSNKGRAASTAQNTNTAGNSNSSAASNRQANSNTVGGTAATATADAGTITDAAQEEAQRKANEELLRSDIKEVQKLYSDYRKFGLAPFNWSGSFKDYATGWRTILGWLVMTLLLSLGAPFWEDALESVFGLKNTLRNKGKTEEKKAQQG